MKLRLLVSLQSDFKDLAHKCIEASKIAGFAFATFALVVSEACAEVHTSDLPRQFRQQYFKTCNHKPQTHRRTISSAMRPPNLVRKHGTEEAKSKVEIQAEKLDINTAPYGSPVAKATFKTFCIDHLKQKLVLGNDAVVAVLHDIYELPSHLIEDLISRLPPIRLYNFQLRLPFQDLTKEDCLHDNSTNNKRKRSRDWNLNTAWRKKFELQWPNLINQIQPTNWQKLYWESHVQKCLDEATEKALVTSFKGRIGNIQVSDGTLSYIGFVGLTIQSYRKYSKLSYHCLQFGSHVSYLRLQSILCDTKTTRLLKECKHDSNPSFCNKHQSYNATSQSHVKNKSSSCFHRIH
ncbi:hypothetical protein KIW84_012799 [Lathyrus oleraceus]|uniref:Uncharacterized protein n=1 Tax=Pisum sativum TaxID=3888 RepID=A0A9D5GWU3_PEA|nr:hypothetical protein KIW84_012799 [Pisum sativum]